MDLTAVLGERAALQQLVADLFRPFEALHVDQVLALHVEGTGAPEADGDAAAALATRPVHRFTTAIAGAIAGAKELGTLTGDGKVGGGEVLTFMTAAADGKSAARYGGKEDGVWGRGADAVCGAVADWVSEVDSIFAVRDALTRLGCDVVGASFVLATNASVLRSLKSAQVAFSCSWNPAHGAKLNTSMPGSDASDRSTNCSCHQTDASNGQSSKKRQRSADIDSDPSVQVLLTHRTAEYQRILAEVTSKNSSDEVSAIVKSAFSRSDEELKQSLLALPSKVRMSKGYCNAGSCAVIALFINSVLYVANVGDCAAVLGKVSKETQGLQAIEVSVDHSCNNPHETKLVVERSHDRNAIRMSKDDQATGAGIVGVKRVAGSLAMTRAFGDFYLKCPELSSAPFKVIATAGYHDCCATNSCVWDRARCRLFFSTASAALIHAALEKIAHRDGLMMHELMSMAQGPVRRRFHDDITCTVVYIDHQNGSQRTDAGDATNQSTPKA
ncbi:unnamed protein product [Phytophthora lilii]|uniref:Unnamed protein product n=1 Tax=Phytophthora lilii TaxID=2077276 RepID=A0A9W6TQ48_9STRA|nr:unnamed protein product [Phytophthora lilii]